ncbi:membrane dipeptidase [Flavihumibacter sp. UBA7668]|uniref:membrane dipeptidase n=1 Tax=Flavihumibacter sp. UBA7668 TaxID=1946542 RepID=UPI0025C6EACA|nr:membrane dipeptidase [Flavihumibacter sp. UBA7668]
MPIFDFHIHPSLKELLAPEEARLSPWSKIEAKLKIGKLFGQETQIGINSLFNHTLNSQANLSQLQQAGVNLAGIVLYSIEKNIARGVLERKVASNGRINPLDPAVLISIRDTPSYYSWLCKNIDSLLKHSDSEGGKARFRFINSINEYQPDATNIVHGICMIEGIHCLMDDPDAPDAEESLFRNLADFQQRYKTKIFAINLAHMQAMPFFTHAFGIQFIKDELFYPKGNGITQAGKRIVKELYKQNILTDLKHLSFVARQQLIELHKYSYPGIPLICTHAAFTGISSRNRYAQLYEKPVERMGVWEIRHVKRRGHLSNSAFNHSSINLYDEEVIDILRSGGLIGLSLDQRILGYPAEIIGYQWNIFPTDHEYISAEEALAFFQPYTDPSNVPIIRDPESAQTGEEIQAQEPITSEIHYSYFLNQLIHFLHIVKQAGIPFNKAIGQICIGSDFDGLINPIDCCNNATEMPEFQYEIYRRLKRGRKIWKESGIAKKEVDIEQLVDGLFYSNALHFLQNHFK